MIQEQVQMAEVTSSQISRIGYDVAEAQLYIEFKNRDLYRFSNISAEQYEFLMAAESIGSYFGKNIKNRREYPYEKLEAGAVTEIVGVEPKAPVDPEVIERSAITIADQAKIIRIANGTEYAAAAEMLKNVVSMRKQVEETFSPMKDAAYKAHRAVCDQEKKIMAPVAEAESYLRRTIADYTVKENEARRAEERRLMEEDRRQKEIAAQAQADELALHDAQLAANAGDHARAEEIIAQPRPLAPIRATPVVIQSEIPKNTGVSTRENWKFRIVDADKVPKEYLQVNETAIGQVVRALKGRTNIAGVEVYDAGGVSVRGA